MVAGQSQLLSADSLPLHDLYGLVTPRPSMSGLPAPIPPATSARDDIKTPSAQSGDSSRDASPAAQQPAQATGTFTVSLRALVSTKEAGAIIGKSGKNVSELRDETGVKAGVSKPISGVVDRIMTVSGSLDSVAKALSIAADTLVMTVENIRNSTPPARQPVTYSNVFNSNHAVLMAPTPNGMATIRLLIPHQQMGSVIGRQGLKIKTIQESTQVRMAASKEMLPQSTERIVEIQGTPAAIEQAVWEVGKCLYDDRDRATGSILYNPSNQSIIQHSLGNAIQPVRASPRQSQSPLPTPPADNTPGGGSVQVSGGSQNPVSGTFFNGSNITTNDSTIIINTTAQPESDNNVIEPVMNSAAVEDSQNFAIAGDMIGCIIGKGGSKIQEIRRTSGAKIGIAKEAYNEAGDRLFTISGPSHARQKALHWLYQQLEGERARRASRPDLPQQ